MNLGIVVNNLVVIFLMIAVGFAAGRAKIVGTRAQGDFTAFLMNVALPCTIFGSMIRAFDGTLIRDSVIIFAMGIVLFGGFMLINRRAAALFRVRGERRGVWAISTAMCNIGFMGFPLVRALYGDDGLFLASIMNLAYNCVAWSLGAKIMAEGTGEGDSVNWKKILCTNTNYSVVLGLICFVTQLPVPGTITTVVTHFGNITTPLSMFLIGLSLSGGRLSETFTDRDVISISAVRLIVVPLIVIAGLHVLPLPQGSSLRGVVGLIMAMPCPSLGMMLAQQYGKDVQLASRAIFLSSLCCIATIPLMLLLV